MQELVRGVWFSRAGECLEQVQTTSISMRLLAAWDGTEIIEQVIAQGKRFGLRPDEAWTALESLYILHGQATWEDGSRTITLGPGDNLAGRPVREPCIMTALTELTVLYICSQPIFHQISSELAHMRQLAVAVEVKDGYTADHCTRIQNLSQQIGQRLRLSSTQQHYLLYGSFLHDLGKIRVPDSILNKAGALTSAEWEVMKQHTVYGRDLLINTSLSGSAFILEQHHERLDGSGYPYGLAGDQISLEAQIVAIADSYDAMTSTRVYKLPLSHEEALDRLIEGRGKHYRPEIVDAFVEVSDKLSD